MPQILRTLLVLCLTLALAQHKPSAEYWHRCGKPGKNPRKNSLRGPSADIVHGDKSGKCKWRWQVGLRDTQDGGNTSRHFCGGTLIGSQWVLTAAHCVVSITDCNLHTLRVVAGDFNSKSDSDPHQVVKGVKQVFVHSNYNVYSEMDQDFALLELEEPMPIGPCIGVACLPEATDDPSASTGERCNITGWGTRRFMGSKIPAKLQEAPVTVMSNEECQAKYENASHITASMICATGLTDEGITDSCQGDSGGPMVCKEKRGYVLRGVTSWGEGCADGKHPGVYSRVSYQLDWIKAVMDGTLPAPAPPPRPADYNGSMWIVTEGPCKMDEFHCITSPNFPGNYSDNVGCKIAVNTSAAVPIYVKEFETEAYYDKLIVGCQEFSGVIIPDGVTPDADIEWVPDGSVVEAGWKICPSSAESAPDL